MCDGRLKLFEKPLLLLLFITLIATNAATFYSIKVIHGDARIVNYVGLVRGGTQRLVKKELLGHPDDALLSQIDGIIEELRTGMGPNGIALLDDPRYLAAQEDLNDHWQELRREILVNRVIPDSDSLHKLSEVFFEKSNSVVFLTERIAEAKLDRIMFLRMLLVVISALLCVIFASHFVESIHLQKNNDILLEKASVDQMTLLPNRWSCDRKIEYHKNFSKLPALLCVSIDLNNLKQINDTYGHAKGDRLIVTFSEILRETCSPCGFIGRNGGDEFLGFFENFDREKEAILLDKMAKAVLERNEEPGAPTVSFSYGSALSSEHDGANIYELLTTADKRMYENKRGYKEKVCVCKPV